MIILLLLVVVMVEDLELAYWTAIVLRLVKVLMDAMLHEEVLEVTWKHHDFVVHLGRSLAQLAFQRAQRLLVKYVQTH